MFLRIKVFYKYGTAKSALSGEIKYQMKTIQKQRHSTKFANKNSNKSKSEKFIIDTEVHVHEDCRLDMQSRQLALNVTRPRL